MEDWARAHKMHAHKQRKKWKKHVMFTVGGLPKFKKIWITYTWVENNKKRDLDNIAGFKKIINDALVGSGIIKNDGWRHIAGWTDSFKFSKEHPPGVFITLKEMN